MGSPYLLPEGNVQIAFSGGRTSGYMLHEILDANGGLPARAIVSFQNTGREMPQTLDFVQEVGSRFGVPIVWLEYVGGPPVGFRVVSRATAAQNGEPFEDLIRRKKALPNQQQRFCSAELKTLTAKRYCRSLGWRKWVNVVGFRADEPHRTATEDVRFTHWMPLRDAGVTKREVAAFWLAQPFDLRLPIFNGKTFNGNCRKCFLKSEAEIASQMRAFPEDDWCDRMEAKTGHTFSKRFSHRELRDYVERQSDLGLDETAFLCQSDGGECFA